MNICQLYQHHASNNRAHHGQILARRRRGNLYTPEGNGCHLSGEGDESVIRLRWMLWVAMPSPHPRTQGQLSRRWESLWNAVCGFSGSASDPVCMSQDQEVGVGPSATAAWLVSRRVVSFPGLQAGSCQLARLPKTWIRENLLHTLTPMSL